MPGTRMDRNVRRSGAFLLLTALATAVSVLGRVASDTDRSGLAESLSAIAANRHLYLLAGAGRLASGVTLLIAAFYLRGTWLADRDALSRLVPTLFGLSGAANAVSGALAIATAQVAATITPLGPAFDPSPTIRTIADLQPLTGTISFALAGLGLVAWCGSLWRASGMLRGLGLVAVVLGSAMQLIWVDAATVLHRISGAAYLIWLALLGGILLSGRAKALEDPTTDAPTPG